VRVSDWSPKDEWIVLSEIQQDAQSDLVLLGLRGGALREYARSPFSETFGSVSPDGRWLAYASDESGQAEIYVDSFPTPRRRARVTMGGGTEPRWGRDGAHIYFRRGSQIHAARVGVSGDSLEAVSTTRILEAGADIRAYDVSTTGRFLVNVPATETRRSLLHMLVHPTSLLPSAP
jgi:Tol biopolymer transport system component